HSPRTRTAKPSEPALVAGRPEPFAVLTAPPSGRVVRHATSSSGARSGTWRHLDWCPMALQIGIVGLPNVGKSTLFNALTKNDALAANYPFATLEPNVGVVGVPDPRLATLAEIFSSARVVPATVSFVDIAGL